jgi:hypothetical protein
MFWILQAKTFLEAWWSKHFGLRDNYYLATLEQPSGARRQVPVMAVDRDAAYRWLDQHYPADLIITMQLQKWG